MKITEASKLAYELMESHDLFTQGWVFEFDRAKKRFGLTQHGKKIISLSRHLTELNDEEHIKDTILHEIAHALVGKGNGHNWRWKMKAREVGANPQRCYDSTKVEKPEYKYSATCPGCETVHGTYKKTRYTYSCGKCAPGRYDENFKLDFQPVGAAA